MLKRHRRAPIFRSASTAGENVRGMVASSRSGNGSGAPRGSLLIFFVAVIVAILALTVGAASAAAPVVTAEAAEQVGVTSALAKGTVNPNGKELFSCRFEYLTEAEYGLNPDEPFEGARQEACEGGPFEKGKAPLPVQAKLHGLTSGTTYHVRLVAEGSDGRNEAEAPTFKTQEATKPVLAMEAAAGVSYSHAKLVGTIDPEGGNTNPLDSGPLPIGWELQYAPASEAEPRNWHTANPTSGNQPIEGASSSQVTVEAEATGLQPGVKYASRLTATYAGGLPADSAGGSFTTTAVAKPTVTIEAVTDATDSTATLIGHVNPNAPQAEGLTSADEEAAFATTWRFECVPGPPPGNGAPCGTPSGTIKAGSASKEVKVELEHLQPNKPYYVVLVASNAGGKSETATPASASFTTGALAPTVRTWAAGPIAPTQVDINAQILPNNSPTTYWFEWGTSDCATSACQSIPATQDASAGEGPIFVYVDRHLSGLQPGTTYHFRVIAENAVAITTGPDQTFTTAAAEAPCPNAGMPGTNFLPDCRGYELVSPAFDEKLSTDVVPDSYATYAAEEGGAVSWESLNAFGEPRGASLTEQYVSRRTGTPGTNGWSSLPITPLGRAPGFYPVLTGNTPTYVGFSSDLAAGIYWSWQTLHGDPASSPVSNLYRLRGLDGVQPQQQLVSEAVKPPTQSEAEASLPRKNRFVGGSRDLRNVLIQSPFDLVGDGHWLGENDGELFEYADGAGVRRVGRTPVGTATECDDQAGSADPCEVAFHAISGLPASILQGGSYSTGSVSADGSRVAFAIGGNIYLREGAQRTYWLNASETTTLEPGAAPPAQFWGMSDDGSRIFFTTGGSLVAEDQDGASQDLYMYEVGKPAGHRLTLLSRDETGDPAQFVSSVVGTSSDGAYVYFIADGQFDPGEPESVEQGLHLWHAGSISYIGAFNDSNLAKVNTPITQWSNPTVTKTARVTPDGRYLLFMSTNDQGFAGRRGYPGFDHGACGSSGCRELYLYSAESGRLTCVSCNPQGGPATADAVTDVNPGVSAAQASQHLSHALSEDGEHVFFTTTERLVPEDTNGFADVYEYDVPSGELHLISSGTSDAPSYFMDASPDGKDVYFDTRERLVGWDTDRSYDLYDARVGGGLPEPVPVPSACEGESCRPTPKGPPAIAPTSSQSVGAGNPPLTCVKGTVKKKGKCVMKRSKRHHGKKHHKPKHAKRAARNQGGRK